MNMHEILSALRIDESNSGAAAGGRFLPSAGPVLASEDPTTGKLIAQVVQASADDYERVMAETHATFLRWRLVPAPLRGQIVREIGDALREKKEPLSQLVSMEMGKVISEARGEVQEMIDMADFAVGQSRMLYGLTMKSERPEHRMMEQWHPLGVVGVITAFNFPVAVWAWNALLAAVAGDTIVWKPSSKVPLTAIAVQHIAQEVAARHGWGGIFGLVIGGRADVGDRLINDHRVPLISATGSTAMGQQVGATVARRLGRSLLELGGNNAVVVLDDANLDMAVLTILFGAVGTAGQRCTSTRRLIVQKGIAPTLLKRLLAGYAQVRIGDPRDPHMLCGPLVDRDAVATMQAALQTAREQGAEILYGGEPLTGPGFEAGTFVRPAIVKARADLPIIQTETFAPILYVVEVEDFDEAMRVHNDVPQGLSSAVFTSNFRDAERFLAADGSDCGIANVNLGTSGAEIGGAFGGEKETGGGRESGSDAWKAYMRRQTNTVNYGLTMPLAQGVTFDL